jgi:aryl-alcohol dehydrogenase
MRMRAAVSRSGQPAPLIESVELEEPRAHELRVRIVAAGICHTDLRAHQGGILPTPHPVVLGHEGAGIVEHVGSAVTTLRPGDAVVLSGSSCGSCPSCRRGLPSYCDEGWRRIFSGRRLDGSSPLSADGETLNASFFGQSSFAEYAIVEERSAVRVPSDVPVGTLAPMGCGVITGAGAVLRSMQWQAGLSLVVFGVGGVGMSAVMAAKLAGASRIIAIDQHASRLDLASELGATHALQAGTDVVAKIKQILPRGVDRTLNTTTVASVFDQAVECLAPTGMAAFVSAPRGSWAPNMMRLLNGGKTLKAIQGGDADPQQLIPLLVEQWKSGRFPFDRLIRRYPFEAIADAFADCASGAAIKPVLEIGQ